MLVWVSFGDELKHSKENVPKTPQIAFHFLQTNPHGKESKGGADSIQASTTRKPLSATQGPGS